MTTLANLKRVLREHPLTRRPYRALGHLRFRITLSFRQLFVDRYYSAQYFDEVFRQDVDPWVYRGRDVPEKRREIILDALKVRRYSNLLEIGCAEGWMTPRLADLADQVVSIDISEVALARAQQECQSRPHVRFQKVDLLTDPLPDGPFDGVVCAGVLVYLPKDEQLRVCKQIIEKLRDHGILLLEHTLIHSPGEVRGKFIHSLYSKRPELELVHQQAVHNPDRDDYLVTVFRKRASEPKNSNPSLS